MSCRWAPWLAALPALLPAQSIDVTLQLPAAGPSFGEAFVVLVTRQWPLGVEVEAFDEAQLSPLTVTLQSIEALRADVAGAGERRRYVARALLVGDVTVPPVAMRWQQGDAVQSVACAVAPFAVRSILPDPPGDVEWPGDGLELPGQGVWWWWLAGCVLLGVGAWVGASRRVARRTVVAPQLALSTANAELAALALPDTMPVPAFYTALKDIVRRHCAVQFRLPTPAQTSEELLLAMPRATTELRACLLPCDNVLFAAMQPTAAAHALAHSLARRFVEATS